MEIGIAVLLSANAAFAGTPRHGVVSLAPNLTELVYAIGFGSQLVARSSACDFPPAAKALPVAGDFGRPNLEAIERLRPALVLVSDVENPAILSVLKESGVQCLKCSCEGWTNLIGAAGTIGSALGDSGRAETWIADMCARRERLRTRVESAWRGRIRPRVYVEIWKEPLTTAGGGSFLQDLVMLAGGQNMAEKLPAAYPHITPEWVVRENPDAILLLYMLENGRNAAEDVKMRMGWKDIAAVKKDAICTDIPPDLLLRSGPRCLEGAEKLADFLSARFQVPNSK